jgi:hypothetical protein
MRDHTRFIETKQSRVSGLSLVAIVAVRGVQNIVYDLERQANPVAIDLYRTKIGHRRSTEIRTDPNRRPNQSACFRSVNRLELICCDLGILPFEVQNLSSNHSIGGPCALTNNSDDPQYPFRRKIR